MIDNVVELAAGAIGGTTLAGILARSFISKSLKDLENAVLKIGDIKSELAAVAVRLEDLSTTNQLVRELDRRMVALETKFHGNNRNPYFKKRT